MAEVVKRYTIGFFPSYCYLKFRAFKERLWNFIPHQNGSPISLVGGSEPPSLTAPLRGKLDASIFKTVSGVFIKMYCDSVFPLRNSPLFNFV